MQNEILAANLVDIISVSGFSLSPHAKDQFSTYLKLLMNSNALHNLTGLKNPSAIIDELFVESFKGFSKMDVPDQPMVLDLGTGAGIPSIPIKILFPHLSMTLIESTNKKSAFLHNVITSLGLKDITVICDRAENVAHDAALREKFDIVLARAVAPLNILIELTLPFLSIGGRLFAYKGPKAPEEINSSIHSLGELGGTIINTVWYSTEQAKKHCIIEIQKQSPTPGKYPRKPGIPKKRPL